MDAAGEPRLYVVEQSHESEVHVQLLVTVKERKARIGGDKVDFNLLVTSDHDYILHHARGGPSGNAGDFKTMPVKMDGMNIVAGIAHADAIALALMQVVCRRHAVA